MEPTEHIVCVVSRAKWTPSSHVRLINYADCQKEMAYQYGSHLSVSPFSLTFIPSATLTDSVASRGAASQRSDLPTILLCSSPASCPSCLLGRRVTD